MKDLEIGLDIERGEVILIIDNSTARLSEDETLATAMVLIGQVIELRKRRRMQ